ncbi:MAG: Crp/Fnr family transcriptional regulator [Peptococcaceae bacterium]
MLTPRYIFADDFKQFYQYFLSQPHIKKTFRKGEYLWAPGSPCEKIHYIVSGAAVHYADHENGRRKIISFHAAGTVYPGYHLNDYKIELSLTTAALSEMTVLEFTKEQFQKMFECNTALSEQVVNWYSMYVNRFLFETVHQEYNSSLIKICNLLYLLTAAETSLSGFTLEMTQDELAEMLGLSRVQLTRGLSELRKRNIILTKRNQIKVIDFAALAALCTSEAL